MKTVNKTMLLILFLLVTVITSNAQNQLYWVHEDHVKPAMQAEYEKTSKELVEACKKYNIQNSDWNAARMDNGIYLSIAPIDNMADLDKNTFAVLSEKMGKDNLAALWTRFNKCYDKHGSYLVELMSDLSYMPNGMTVTTEGQNYRKYHYFYVTPANSKAVADKLKEIKALFASKGSKEHYRIYHSGFGTMGEYYMAAVSAKDVQDYEKTSDENEKLLGEEWRTKFNELFLLSARYDVKTGYMRPDLGYSTKK